MFSTRMFKKETGTAGPHKMGWFLRSTREMTGSRRLEIPFTGIDPEVTESIFYSAPDVNSFDIEKSEMNYSLAKQILTLDLLPNTVVHIQIRDKSSE